MAEFESDGVFDFAGLEKQFVRPSPEQRRTMGLLALVGRPEIAALGVSWTGSGEFTGLDPGLIMDRLAKQAFSGALPAVGDRVANIRLPDLFNDGLFASLDIEGPPTRISWRSGGVEAPANDPLRWCQFNCFVFEYEQVCLAEEPDFIQEALDVIKGEIEVGVRIGVEPGRITPSAVFYRTDSIIRNGELLADTGLEIYPDYGGKEVDAYIRLMRELRALAASNRTTANASENSLDRDVEQSE